MTNDLGVKNEQIWILKLLINTEQSRHNCETTLDYSISYDDKERYIKMALQIDPSDFALLDRNENITAAIKK